MTRRAAFWWGVLGSIAPEVLRFFKLLQSGQPLPNLQWIIYALFLLVYMCLAGAATCTQHGGFVTVMHAHSGEILSEGGLHIVPHRIRKRTARAQLFGTGWTLSPSSLAFSTIDIRDPSSEVRLRPSP